MPRHSIPRTTGFSARAPLLPGDPALARRLEGEVAGEVLFDPFSRGRYSTDASIYQIEPLGVVVPRSAEDVARTIEIAAEAGAPVLARGGGTSQCGQTVGRAVVVDVSKHLDRVRAFDAGGRAVTVEPGITLDRLNAFLKPHGLWFPVDISTGDRATLGGMAGNNSCGTRSLRYGTMRDNVRAIHALLPDGRAARFGEVPWDADAARLPAELGEMVSRLFALGRREADEIASRMPTLMRRVGGYNIDALVAHAGAASGTLRGHNREAANLAHLLVGSEGTLAFTTLLELELAPIPPHRALGVCHFPTFHKAMESAQHIVKLDPSAVELVDRTMIELARAIPMYRATVDQFVRGEPEALLLVEFAGDDREVQLRDLRRLGQLMGDLGLGGAVVEIADAGLQRAVWEVRKAGLNIMMSMKGEGKPVSFIEDCAVRLEDLAAYTARLTEVFRKHGTMGTWYAHASVGCLHVRPVLNLKSEIDVKKMRAIAEEAFALVREYKGSHSGEHGDGLVRSEFHEAMFGARLVNAFAEIKTLFDPEGLMNPGKIVNPSKMDDRALFRYPPGYGAEKIEPALDWSEWGGFAPAVEMCNNNGACRKRDGGVMCPSYRATGDEAHVTRGRANALRLALSGQLGKDALLSDAMAEAMKLCVGCKGCRRECPTGVDMARMKIEVLHQRARRLGVPFKDKLIAHLPRYAPLAARMPWLFAARDFIPGLAGLSELVLGLSARRSFPRFSSVPFDPAREEPARADPNARPDRGALLNARVTPAGVHSHDVKPAREVVLWADTFNTYFEPENARAALRVLTAGGYRVHLARPRDGGRALCCGRTYLAAGMIAEARAEASRLLAVLVPFARRGVPIVGLEPSCLLGLRDEIPILLPGDEAKALANQAVLFEEFLAAEAESAQLDLPLKPLAQRALLHPHCHQKAFGVVGAVERTLRLVPDLDVETIEAGCCGMAGAFGFGADTFDVSMRMAGEALLPVLARAGPDILVVANGTSCRHQIADGSGRSAVHVARVLEQALTENRTRQAR
ncbi:MAG: FAD-binding oxidoreductase [Rhodospirillales bacterium]|nr:FAD-binding oxidoreductase [Rhodospirillales bacterium]MSP79675.1 FAD-binding oxidoreductase [Rhodospirillales bacterium]